MKGFIIMTRNASVPDVAEEIFQSILATPKRQRKLLSSTFWAKFGFEKRSKERVEQVKEALKRRSLMINLDDIVFGKEAKDEWIILNYIEPIDIIDKVIEPPIKDIPTPSDSWFETIGLRVFESEREVEYYFIVPLLEQLGYEENDFAIGYPVQMYEGTSSVRKEADFVIFNGSSRKKEDALLIVEAKKTERILTEAAIGQARAYAMWLTTPYYIVTNGDDIRVYLFRGAVQPDVILMNFKRNELRQNWGKLYTVINKAAVIKHKEKWVTIFAASGI
jgi:hypothetical protein